MAIPNSEEQFAHLLDDVSFANAAAPAPAAPPAAPSPGAAPVVDLTVDGDDSPPLRAGGSADRRRRTPADAEPAWHDSLGNDDEPAAPSPSSPPQQGASAEQSAYDGYMRNVRKNLYAARIGPNLQKVLEAQERNGVHEYYTTTHLRAVCRYECNGPAWTPLTKVLCRTWRLLMALSGEVAARCKQQRW